MCKFVFNNFLVEGGEEMVAMLWAQQIMLGKAVYSKVPQLLKERVQQLLTDSGYEELTVA